MNNVYRLLEHGCYFCSSIWFFSSSIVFYSIFFFSPFVSSTLNTVSHFATQDPFIPPPPFSHFPFSSYPFHPFSPFSLFPDTCIHLLCSINLLYLLFDNCSLLYPYLPFRSGTNITINVDQLNQILNSGILQLWIEKVRSSVVSLSGGRQSEIFRHNLQTIASEIIEMKIFINSMISQ